MVHSKRSPYKNECNFMNPIRSKGRKLLFRDIIELTKHHSELEPYDITFTLGLVIHKVKEKHKGGV